MGTSVSPVEPRDLVPERDALFLDFDGTLVEIAPTPSSVRVAPYLADLLLNLERRLGGALALVTGRPVADVDGFLAPYRPAVAGVHGRDLRLPRTGERLREPVDAAVLGEARRLLEAVTARYPGTLLEDKGESVALHYRNASPGAGEAVRAAALAAVEAGGGALKLLPGKMVVELMPAGVDKGVAIERLLARAPFAGRTPVFVGDDVTDEAGFLVTRRLGGLGIKIGGGTTTAAGCYLPDVQALHAWLRRAAAAAVDQRGTQP